MIENKSKFIIYELIKKEGSQKKLADKLGCGQSTVSTWLNGDLISVINCLKIEKIYKIKKALLRPDIFN